MKAAQLTGIRQLEILDVPDPIIKNDDDVLIRMNTVGICGSDVHYYVNGAIGNRIVEYPFTIGHEGAGTVEAVGTAVTNLKIGDRIAIDPAITCGECDQCLAGRENTCRNLSFAGCPDEAPGIMSEFIVMPERCCVPISESTTLDQAVFSEPLSIGVYAVKNSIDLEGKDMIIQGAGPIGLSVLMAAKEHNPNLIAITDRIVPRLDIAADAGADWTGNIDKINVIEEFAKVAPKGADVVFECCGEHDALNEAMDLLKPGGKLVIVGIPEGNRISLDINTFRHNELTIYSVRRQNKCVEKALELIAKDPTLIDNFITHRFSLEDAKKGFDLVASYKDGVVKAMVSINDEG